MDFPKVWDQQEWTVIERDKEFWCDVPNGVQVWLGTQVLYKSLKRPNEAVREINIYRRGAVGRIWYRLVDDELVVVASQIVKDGEWVTGLPGAGIQISTIRAENKYLGVQLQLETERDKPLITVNIFRDRKRTSEKN